jgi:glycosyltransferase involved in cell wall biosynthesis
MKILYYSPHPNLNLAAPSGPGTHMREVINAFRQMGHEVETLILGGEEMNQDDNIQFKESGSKQILKKILPESVWQTLKDVRLRRFDRYAEQVLKEKIKDFQPDLVYERGYYLMTSGVKMSKAAGLRHMIELNAPYPEEKIAMEGQSFLINKSNVCEYEQVTMSERVIVVSSALEKYLSDRYPEAEGKIVVTPNAININKLQVDQAKCTALRTKLNFEEKTVIGFVGSIFPYHGVDRLLDAFTSMEGDYPNARLLIVGDGETRPQLEEKCERLGLSDKVHFSGNVRHADVPNYIELMDITVMPKSNWYGSPVKIFEYGLLKKAIIAPDNVPVRDVMIPDVDGILILDSVDELKSALTKLLKDEELRQRVADSFHQKVTTQHRWQDVATKILAP